MSSIFDTLSLSVRLVNASICSSSFSCSIISLLAFHLNSSQVISSFWTLSFPTYFPSRPSLSHTSISYPFSPFPFPFPFLLPPFILLSISLPHPLTPSLFPIRIGRSLSPSLLETSSPRSLSFLRTSGHTISCRPELNC